MYRDQPMQPVSSHGLENPVDIWKLDSPRRAWGGFGANGGCQQLSSTRWWDQDIWGVAAENDGTGSMWSVDARRSPWDEYGAIGGCLQVPNPWLDQDIWGVSENDGTGSMLNVDAPRSPWDEYGAIGGCLRVRAPWLDQDIRGVFENDGTGSTWNADVPRSTGDEYGDVGGCQEFSNPWLNQDILETIGYDEFGSTGRRQQLSTPRSDHGIWGIIANDGSRSTWNERLLLPYNHEETNTNPSYGITNDNLSWSEVNSLYDPYNDDDASDCGLGYNSPSFLDAGDVTGRDFASVSRVGDGLYNHLQRGALADTNSVWINHHTSTNQENPMRDDGYRNRERIGMLDGRYGCPICKGKGCDNKDEFRKDDYLPRNEVSLVSDINVHATETKGRILSFATLLNCIVFMAEFVRDARVFLFFLWLHFLIRADTW